MSKRRVDPALLREVATCLRKALLKHGLKPAEAAKKLGVERQTLWLYLNEKAMPGGAVLERACELWDLTLNVKGFSFTKGAFQRPKTRQQPSAKQLDLLFDVIEQIKPNQIETKLIGRAGGFELRVRIKAAS
jgi:transcriptional regulator with XRE-family HTH domain